MKQNLILLHHPDFAGKVAFAASLVLGLSEVMVAEKTACEERLSPGTDRLRAAASICSGENPHPQRTGWRYIEIELLCMLMNRLLAESYSLLPRKLEQFVHPAMIASRANRAAQGN